MELHWRARDKRTGECCPHHHHSPQSAKRCGERFGDDCVIERFDNDAEYHTSKRYGPNWCYRKKMRTLTGIADEKRRDETEDRSDSQ